MKLADLATGSDWIRTGIPQRRGTKRTRRMFTSVADLGVFRGCQNSLESDRASAAAWGE